MFILNHIAKGVWGLGPLRSPRNAAPYLSAAPHFNASPRWVLSLGRVPPYIIVSHLSAVPPSMQYRSQHNATIPRNASPTFSAVS